MHVRTAVFIWLPPRFHTHPRSSGTNAFRIEVIFSGNFGFQQRSTTWL